MKCAASGLLTALLLIALPLAGIIGSGRDPAPYLQMPPVTGYVHHADFSWPWFGFFTVADLALLAGLVAALRCGRRNRRREPSGVPAAARFPWWGWAGTLLCLAAWLMAWQRFDWFWLFQPHTFQPIWGGFILAVNALTVKRSGSCLITRRPLGFVLLFPASAGFWWFFEYLNRFVQNWYYTGIEGMGPMAYSYFSSLAFATVLPGVASMIELLATLPTLGDGLARCSPLRFPGNRRPALVLLAAAGTGLALIGCYPNPLFALVWVSPLLIALCMQTLFGCPTVLHPLRHGDWRPLVIPALAALVCGFFWEMWNFFSLARWTYSIPYVQRFHLFAMPLPGYGGYLPFGLLCFMAAKPIVGDPLSRPGAAGPDEDKVRR